MRAALIFPVLLTAGFCGVAQPATQVLRGRVLDAASASPVKDAIVCIWNEQTFYTRTDSSGNYKVRLNVGQYALSVRHMNYSAALREKVMLHSAKQAVEDFELEAFSALLDSVQVQASATIHGEAIDAWNTQRFAAAFYDPARAITSFASAINTDDQSNTISVRGSSPNYLQWRLEGVEIVNPNHLENAGTINDRPALNGGGVSMISAQLLRNSSFLLSPFDAASGNALSGIFDIRLRNGNNERMERTVQASLLGTDLALEGPLNKRSGSSCLLNFRYSTVGLLSQLGVNFGNEQIHYKDLSVLLNFPTTSGALRFFAIAGNSENIFRGATDSADVKSQKDLSDIDYHSATMIYGGSWVHSLGNTAYFKTVVAWSEKSSRRNSQPKLNPYWPTAASELDELKQQKLSFLAYFSKRAGNRLKLKVGTYVNDFFTRVLSTHEYSLLKDGNVHFFFLQPFVAADALISQRFSLEGGLHSMWLGAENEFILLPKLSLAYKISDSQSLKLHFGEEAQLPPADLLLSNTRGYLGATRSRAASLIHQMGIRSIRLKTEIFHQLFYQLPVNESAGFSAYNYFNRAPSMELLAEGRAQTYGVDASVQRNFRSLYFIFSACIFNSTFTYKNIQSPSRFNSRYNVVATLGKEIQLKDGRRYIDFNVRGMLRNGFRQGVDPEYPETYTSSARLPYYFRLDTRISLRKEKNKSSWVLALDIQNTTNRKNVAWYYYDVVTGAQETRFQLGMIPVLSFRIFF